MRRTGKKAKAWFCLFQRVLTHENSFKLMKEFSVIEKQPRGHAKSLLAAGFFSAARFFGAHRHFARRFHFSSCAIFTLQ